MCSLNSRQEMAGWVLQQPRQTLLEDKGKSWHGAQGWGHQLDNKLSMSCVYVANWAWKVPPTLSLCHQQHSTQMEIKIKEKSVLPLAPLPSQTQAVGERFQLLLSEPLLLLQVLLTYEQRGLGLDEALVVLQLLGRQLTGQEGGDHVLSPVQIILQIFGILPLFAQQTVAAVQRLLSAETECSDKSYMMPTLFVRHEQIAGSKVCKVCKSCVQWKTEQWELFDDVQTATGLEVQCFLKSTEGRVDTSVIETRLEFRWVSVNTSVADNSKKTNEPLTRLQRAARSARLLQMDTLTRSLFRGKSRNLTHPCKHELMLRTRGHTMKRDYRGENKEKHSA